MSTPDEISYVCFSLFCMYKETITRTVITMQRLQTPDTANNSNNAYSSNKFLPENFTRLCELSPNLRHSVCNWWQSSVFRGLSVVVSIPSESAMLRLTCSDEFDSLTDFVVFLNLICYVRRTIYWIIKPFLLVWDRCQSWSIQIWLDLAHQPRPPKKVKQTKNLLCCPWKPNRPNKLVMVRKNMTYILIKFQVKKERKCDS